MSECTFVGIDVSKETFDVSFKIDSGKFKHRSFSNTKTGFNALLRWLERYTVNVSVCMEATGHYSEPLAEFLYDHEVATYVVNPVKIRHHAKSTLNRNKNDKLDSKIIALFHEKSDDLRPFKPRSSDQKTLSELVHFQGSLTEECKRTKQKISASQSPRARKFMKSTLKKLEKQLLKLDEELKELISQDEKLAHVVMLLCSIKGFAWRSACALAAGLPDISQFESPKQLAAFVGVSPMQRESGKYKGQTKLSKLGDAKLRKVLYMPALVAKQHNEHLRPFCRRLEASGKTPKQIVGALMRKLLHLIYGMLKTNTMFDPTKV